MKVSYEHEGYTIRTDTREPSVYEIWEGDEYRERGKYDDKSSVESVGKARIKILIDKKRDSESDANSAEEEAPDKK